MAGISVYQIASAATRSSSRSGEGYGYFFGKKQTVSDCSLLLNYEGFARSSNWVGERTVSAVARANWREGTAVKRCCALERCQPALTRFMHVRIVPSQPNFGKWSQGLAARMPDCLSGETGSTPVATAMRG